MSTLTEAAVDATLNVTAELARVTAERDGLLLKSVDAVTEQRRRADSLETEVSSLRAEVNDIAKDRDEAEARAERAEKVTVELERERGEVNAALREEIEGKQQVEKANAALRAALEELVTPNRGMGFGGMDRRFAEENARAALADPNLGADWVPRAELVGAEQQIAAWRVLAERARKHLTEATHSEDCARTDECDEADPGECGEHGSGGCPACDCGASEWHETAADLYAALKETT